jgi:glycosyltransferase involved in cell wall biosynthesis
MTKQSLTVIIPCYNEANTVEIIIDRIIKSYKENKQIIVIDDGSTDGSKEILKKIIFKKIDHLILNEKNYGKGFSIRKGIEVATGDVILIQDADLEYDPNDYYKLINPIKNNYADVVYGSRFISSDEKRVLYYWHSLGNFFLTFLSNVFSNINLTDMEVCFKVFRTNILKNIKLYENRFGFEPEVTAKIAKLNLRIFEVGIKYYGRKYSEGKKVNWKDGLSAIRCIIYYNTFSK